MHYFKGLEVAWLGGRDRTSEWRNQNLLDYSTISKRIWKKWSIPDPVISIGWLVLPNEKERHGQLETPD
ncbi:hypothetical protein [Bradyrhizobium guangzhouense]|uniref:hypothetical protein n=1 Tax=Bradyrhizobium guangzhouense TaxID=1325095 RepID=UPI001009F6D7|nr:hypothetical protein [Bradyrhizobium guangzhouense]